MWKAVKYPLLCIYSSFFFFGCASKDEKIQEIIVIDREGPQTRYRPNVSTRNSDARIITDAGVMLKIWIAPYTTRAGFLVAGHDVYYQARKPEFITGRSVPRRTRGVGATTPTTKIPFSIAPTEIDRSNLDNDNVILKYMDNVQNLKKTEVIKRNAKAPSNKPKKINTKKQNQAKKPQNKQATKGVKK